MKFLLNTPPSRLCGFLISVQAIALTLAIPTHLSPLLVRSLATCANFPGVAAGSYVGSDGSNTAAALAAGHRRRTFMRWCSPNSSTSLILSITTGLTRAMAYPMLAEAFEIVSNHIATVGDGTVLGGAFNFETKDGALLSIWNANNHQTTWGVLRAAIVALADNLEVKGYGEVIFTIYDGENLVGEGQLTAW